jgi:hypothetical protein
MKTMFLLVAAVLASGGATRAALRYERIVEAVERSAEPREKETQ